jgi:hypothetical protein
LEGQGAALDALHERRARQQRFVGFAHVGVCAFVGAALAEDCGGLPVGCAVWVGLKIWVRYDFFLLSFPIFAFAFSFSYLAGVCCTGAV